MDPNVRLKVALLQRRMKQKHLAQIVQKSEATVSNWILGKCRPAQPEREQISRILNIPERELFKDATKVPEYQGS